MFFVLVAILLFGLWLRERNQRVALEKRTEKIYSVALDMWKMVCLDKKMTDEEIKNFIKENLK